jgi:hypothetical protein
VLPAPGSAGAPAPAAEHEVVEEAEGLRLHLSSSNATGYKCVCHAPNSSQSRPYRVRSGDPKAGREGSLRVNLGSFTTAVEAAVSYARYVQSQQEAKQGEGEVQQQQQGEQVGPHDESAAQTSQATRVFADSSEDEAQSPGDAAQIDGDASQIAAHNPHLHPAPTGNAATPMEVEELEADSHELATEAEGLQLHLSSTSKTGGQRPPPHPYSPRLRHSPALASPRRLHGGLPHRVRWRA